jgi:hypothetical protein
MRGNAVQRHDGRGSAHASRVRAEDNASKRNFNHAERRVLSDFQRFRRSVGEPAEGSLTVNRSLRRPPGHGVGNKPAKYIEALLHPK